MFSFWCTKETGHKIATQEEHQSSTVTIKYEIKYDIKYDIKSK